MFGRQDTEEDTTNQPLDDKDADYVNDLTTTNTGNSGDSDDANNDAADKPAEPSEPVGPPPSLKIPKKSPVIADSKPTDASSADSTDPDNPLVPNDDLTESYDPSLSPGGARVAPTREALQSLRLSALDELTPLVDQLDQPPEEAFRTIMMLMQASDNPELINQAYVAAKDIKDDKIRAQALLDVVNEINYFTQPKADSSEPTSGD